MIIMHCTIQRLVTYFYQTLLELLISPYGNP